MKKLDRETLDFVHNLLNDEIQHYRRLKTNTVIRALQIIKIMLNNAEEEGIPEINVGDVEQDIAE